ncbi:hypothetical protein ASZ90_003197 [hydrocarbon metagenome]|uniref:Uncharacterized protein n=1 Tax=hydrocarbon metagenome TaxID=938273 RepID=A0A0W8G1I4_9ZZZZ
MYIVGGNGSIAHYNGTTWRKIESGTELTLSDIYGTNTGEVYVSGVRSSDISGILLNGNQSGFTVVKKSGIIDSSQLFDQLYGELASVWIDEKGTVYVGGNLLYWNRRGEWNYVKSLPENILDGIPPTNFRGFISSIRGNAFNDFVIVGERNTIKHFNGISWQQLGIEYDPNNPIDWYTVRQKENTLVAVGTIGNKATIIKLKR